MVGPVSMSKILGDDSLTEFITRAASSIVDTQQQLDRQLDARLASLLEHRVDVPAEVWEASIPAVTRVEQLHAEFELVLSESRRVDASTSLRLGARPVTTFAEARFGRSEQTVARLRIEVRAQRPFDGGDDE